MRFSVDERVFAHYPELHIAVVVIRDANNTGVHPEIQAFAQREANIAREMFTAMPIADHPNIQAWRAAYQVFGPASRYHSSVESLVTRVAKGKDLPVINPFVDLYNAISLKYLVPIGGEDLKKVVGDISLTIADGSEHFVPLGEEANDPPEQGEVIYRDGQGCLCRRFNWREADRTKLTSATKHAIFSVEALPPLNDIDVKEAAAALAEQLQKYCGGTIDTFLVNHQRPSIELPQ